MLYLQDFDLTRVVASGNNCIVLGQFIINRGPIQQSLEDASALIYVFLNISCQVLIKLFEVGSVDHVNMT